MLYVLIALQLHVLCLQQSEIIQNKAGVYINNCMPQSNEHWSTQPKTTPLQ